MVYVALSRCRMLQGLWVRGLRKYHVRVSENAKLVLEKVLMLYNFNHARVINGLTVKRLHEEINSSEDSNSSGLFSKRIRIV